MHKCVILWGAVCWLSVNTEYFTSSSHLRSLFESERELTDKLKDYISKEESRLKKLKDLYGKVNIVEKIKSKKDINLYIGNPVQAVKILRRMVRLWPKIRKWSVESKQDFSRVFKLYEDVFPTSEDLSGAQEAMLRLQNTFSLTSHEIVEGLSNNIPTSKLGVDDAYNIGKKAYAKSEHYRTATWMNEALRLLDLKSFLNEEVVPSRFDVLDHLAWSEYMNENLPSAYTYTKELLKLDPENDRIQNNERFFRHNLEEQEISLQNVTKLHIEQVKKQRQPYVKNKQGKFETFYYTQDENTYKRYKQEKDQTQALCRGETKPLPKNYTRYMICFYKSKHPLLVLKPAKVERIYVKPEIVLFRDAMSDAEIQRVKELAHPKLQRATVHNPATGKLEFADYRVSKSAWLDENDDELVDVMSKRIEAYTGLNMETAEKLQVANYGIGGHYETHFDFARTTPLRPPPWKDRLNYTIRVQPKSSNHNPENGHRIATVLFYMTNVDRGGATVFINIGLAVKPSKGDAVFWYNLHHDGSGDYNTRHAACPVLIGEKWVSNRWIHERGQEFRRKCQLKPEDDYHLHINS